MHIVLHTKKLKVYTKHRWRSTLLERGARISALKVSSSIIIKSPLERDALSSIITKSPWEGYFGPNKRHMCKY